MARLTFSKDLVRRLVEHSRAAPAQREYYGTKITEPSLMLVKDEGAYLMSAGNPGLLIPGGGTSHVVAYAKGYDPTVADRGEVWDKCHNALGGDDFSEPLPCSFFDKALADERDVIVMNVNANRISIEHTPAPESADERKARLAVTIARLLRESGLVIVARKRRQRTVKIWSTKSQVAPDSPEAKRWLSGFENPVILSGLSLDDAARAAIARLDQR